eukprot:scaffold32812_cov39-Phaeocystis_antarctica.AAC.1
MGRCATVNSPYSARGLSNAPPSGTARVHAPTAVGDLQGPHVLERLRGVELQATHAERRREALEELREVHL